jgi:heme-degrading monooxygenase HmoA
LEKKKGQRKMTVKIIIKRIVPQNKTEALKPLLQELRNQAMQQPGYISGETFKRIDRPGESLVVSTWHSMEDWKTWLMSDKRRGIQEKIDHLLGENTEFEIYAYD